MSARSDTRTALPGHGGAGGFTLIEMLAVLACLGMIFWMAGQLLFPMRTAAERQRLDVEARQTARAAADFLGFALRGATDNNPVSRAPRDPLAIMVYRRSANVGTGDTVPSCPGGAGDCTQLTYNNVADGSNFADPGTDVITVGRFDEPAVVQALRWTGGLYEGSTLLWWFSLGCPGDTPGGVTADNNRNRARWEAMTGRGSVPGHGDWSKPMVIYDTKAAWGVYQITDYKDGLATNTTSCSAPNGNCTVSGVGRPCFEVDSSPGADAIYAPGSSRRLAGDSFIATGARFGAYRVCNGWLQQKDFLFDPATDNNCVPGGDGNTAGWTSLLPNIEDMQIAYVYNDGQVFNTSRQQLQGTDGNCGLTVGVPCQGYHGDSAVHRDVTSVVALRVTVVARSSQNVVGFTPNQQRRLVEDTAVPAQPPDSFRRHVVSVNALLRNRLPSR